MKSSRANNDKEKKVQKTESKRASSLKSIREDIRKKSYDLYRNVENIPEDAKREEPSEYAENKVADTVKKESGKIIRDARIKNVRIKNKILDIKTKDGYVKKANKAIKKTAKAVKETSKASAKTAGKGGKEAAKVSAKTTVKAAGEGTKAAVKVTKEGVKLIGKALKALEKGIESLIKEISSGGAAAVIVVLLIALIAIFCTSCFGLFLDIDSDEKNGEYNLKDTVSSLTTEFYSDIDKEKDNYSYDIAEYSASTIEWKDILSVFSIKYTNDKNGGDVVLFNDEKKKYLKNVLCDMTQIDYNTYVKEIETQNENEQGKEKRSVTVLEISISNKSIDDMAEYYSFDDNMKKQLEELNDNAGETLWEELLGNFEKSGVIMDGCGYINSDYDFIWPLTEKGRITSRFGYRNDPFTGVLSYHCGTDIGIAEGTPILAIADGYVEIANGTDSWGGSYGYYVKLSHNGSYSSLYAHCSKICVHKGESVKKGEVIGYVGSTGNSTGNHLHFEIWYMGKREDALLYYNM